MLMPIEGRLTTLSGHRGFQKADAQRCYSGPADQNDESAAGRRISLRASRLSQSDSSY